MDKTKWIENVNNKYMPIVPKDIENYNELYKAENWIRGNGDIVKIVDMEDKHIINSIKMIRRICDGLKVNPIDYKIYNMLTNYILNKLIDENDKLRSALRCFVD